MKKTFCDRCGKEFVRLSDSNVMFPYYEIKRFNPMSALGVDVDLCKDCRSDFAKWLRNGKADN